MKTLSKLTWLFSFVLFLLSGQVVRGQQDQHLNLLACGSTISVFPYDEGFETGDGNWITGGTATDWTWGAPSKPVISTAGGGSKSWVTGGLAGTSYNDSENSWLESPCFDFSSLTSPEISFKIFWETERRFDGASLQYSTNDGASWTPLGDINSNTNCNGQNWYNTIAITYLPGNAGWSGNIQSGSGSCLGGNGSNGWLTARHTLSMLSGLPLVKFRFLFGSGSTCNSFDGFAIDDIQIREAMAQAPDISASCTNNRQVAFSTSAFCVSSYTWNFGDPGSGSNNISTVANPSHQFSGPGTFNVLLNLVFASGPPVTLTKEVVILGIDKSIDWPGQCTGAADATLSVTPSGSNTPYFYYWNTSPPQTTPSISNIGPNTTVTVTVSSLNACSMDVVFIQGPATVIQLNAVTTDAACTGNNGSISTNVTGGTAPYQYTWSNGSTTPLISQLAAGNYALQVTDQGGCVVNSGSLEIKTVVNMLPVDLGTDKRICPGQTLILDAGNYASYRWQDNSMQPTFNVRNSGIYYVSVTDVSGCTGADTIKVTVDCSGIYFPTAYTPNADNRNDGFGPLGNLAGLRKYSLAVYNRFGEKVFYSTNPYYKWDGSYKAVKSGTASFVWVAGFELNGVTELRKGTILLLK